MSHGVKIFQYFVLAIFTAAYVGWCGKWLGRFSYKEMWIGVNVGERFLNRPFYSSTCACVCVVAT